MFLLSSSLRLTLLGACLAPLTLLAQTINLSYNGEPNDKNAVHVFASKLKAAVEAKTDGKIELKLYPNSMLGEEQERMEQTMQSPSLNIASFAGVSPVLPEIFVSATPFMFKDFTTAHKFFDEGSYWKMVSDDLAQRTGVEMLGVVEEGGFLAFTNDKRPIKSPADFKGLRFRAMDPSQVALYKAFGASGTPIPWTEVYMALKTGVADGQMNPPMYIILGSLFEVQKYMTLANIQYSDQFLVGNKAMIDSWDADTKKEFYAAVKQAINESRKINEAEVQKRIDFLKGKGMEIITPSDSAMQEFRDLSKPAYSQFLKEQKIDAKYIKAAAADLDQ